jgi:acetylornithine deacetylase
MEKKTIDAISDSVDQLEEEMVSTLQRLVRIPSVIGNEGPAQEFLRQEYGSFGLEARSVVADRTQVEKHPAFCDSGIPFEGRPNILGIQKGDPDKNSIILNGHVDVVSPEPIQQWTHDPWGGETDGNRLYGRGALDMKAGLIANLFSLKALQRAGLNPGGTVMLQSVIEEEEGGGGGALACFMEGFTADGMIVSEPAPFINIALAGIMRFGVKVQGKPAHPAQSQLGINAIGKMLKLYKAIEKLDVHRKATVRFPLFEEQGDPAAHLITGTLNAGDHIATVAGFAEMGCRVGFIPGEERGQIKNLIETTIRQVADNDDWLREHPPVIEWLPFEADPYYQDPGHPFVQTVLSAAQTVAEGKTEVKTRGATWSEDTRFAQYFGFPALSLGPIGEHPHGVDEYVDLDSLVLATKVIAVATLEWCSQEKTNTSRDDRA